MFSQIMFAVQQERGDESSGGEAVQTAGLISQYTGVAIKVSIFPLRNVTGSAH